MFAKKPVHVQDNAPAAEHSLKRVLKPLDLVLLGIGAIVGTGVFVLPGVAAASSGNALPISFVIAGIACLLAALCYAEFSTMIPVAGSAYTYCYAALGEIWAWVIGWDLILEYGFAISAVAIGWSGYFNTLLSTIGIVLPPSLSNPMGVAGGIVNLPAIFIVLTLTALLVAGTKKSTKFNAIIVALKLGVILLFICLGFVAIQPANWQPLMPPEGWFGVFQGAAIVFFAFIGFDAVVTAAEEVENPQKNLPLGIIGSLAVCMVLYIIVAVVLTGILPYSEIAKHAAGAPIAYALNTIGYSWGAALVSIGALFGMTSVMLVMIFGQSRILFSMSRDGLFPRVFSEIHPVTRTPAKVTICIGVITALVAGIASLEFVTHLVNLGTLVAFSIVALGVIILRYKQPNLPRPFRCPLVPVIPILCLGSCGLLIWHLNLIAINMFFVWLAVGLFIYFVYGMKNSGNRGSCRAKDLEVISSHINPETPFPEGIPEEPIPQRKEP